MNNLTLKQKIMAIVAIVGTILILIFQRGLYSNNPGDTKQETKSEQSQSNEIKIVATKPSPLDESIILPTQNIEITFNDRLVNTPEFKHKLEPEVAYKLELSEDHKTIKIIPSTTFKLGTGYTLFIYPDAKFEGGKTLGKETIIHFRTIDYKGI